ncbi:hypothetical protein [Novacetimonas pomaceti]|nr:hypothetical protein [Novacetimonas pomaceti]
MAGPWRPDQMVRGVGGRAECGRRFRLPLFLLLGVAMLTATGGKAMAASWPDTPLLRMRMMAEIEALQVALLTQPSATVTLEKWCATHAMASPAHVLARQSPGADTQVPRQVRADLGVGPSVAIRHRRVALTCGTHVLSLADNWYVPSRLTDAMNDRLDHTDVPFGHVVASLRFTRRTLDSTLLWSPLPAGWEHQPVDAASVDAVSPGGIQVPDEILRNRAVLSRQDGQPFSEVVETYTGAVLDFVPPDDGHR